MRTPECTPEVIAEIVKAIEEGLTLESAATLVGVTDRTLRNWKTRSRTALEAMAREEAVDPLDEPYLPFLPAITRARIEAKREAVRDIKYAVVRTKDGDIPDWRARAWWLSRAFPEEFTERVDVRVRDEATEYVFARLREKLDDATFERVMGCFDPEDASEVPAAETQH